MQNSVELLTFTSRSIAYSFVALVRYVILMMLELMVNGLAIFTPVTVSSNIAVTVVKKEHSAESTVMKLVRVFVCVIYPPFENAT